MITKLGYAAAMALLQRAQSMGIAPHVQAQIKREAFQAGKHFKGAPNLRARAYDAAASKASQRLAPQLHNVKTPPTNAHLYDSTPKGNLARPSAPVNNPSNLNHSKYLQQMNTAASWLK